MIVLPLFAHRVSIHPGLFFWYTIIAGMIWQFLLSVIILRKELGKLTIEKIKERIWLNHPIHSKSKQIFKKAYLLTIPIIIYAALVEQFGFFSFLENGFIRLLPFLEGPEYIKIQSLMAPEFVGSWYLVVITTISSIFNYLLGEALFFRGILLPKMNGAFGKWDWVVNGLLFSTYYLHKIVEIPIYIIGSFFISFLNKKYKSFYPALIIHGVEAIPLFIIIIFFVGGIIS